MAWYLLHGDLVQAVRHHPVRLVGAPFALYTRLTKTMQIWFGRRRPWPRLSRCVHLGYATVWTL